MEQCPDNEELTLSHLELGAEPYWMQDVRLASRAIEDQRKELAKLRGDSIR